MFQLTSSERQTAPIHSRRSRAGTAGSFGRSASTHQPAISPTRTSALLGRGTAVQTREFVIVSAPSDIPLTGVRLSLPQAARSDLTARHPPPSGWRRTKPSASSFQVTGRDSPRFLVQFSPGLAVCSDSRRSEGRDKRRAALTRGLARREPAHPLGRAPEKLVPPDREPGAAAAAVLVPRGACLGRRSRRLPRPESRGTEARARRHRSRGLRRCRAALCGRSLPAQTPSSATPTPAATLRGRRVAAFTEVMAAQDAEGDRAATLSPTRAGRADGLLRQLPALPSGAPPGKPSLAPSRAQRQNRSSASPWLRPPRGLSRAARAGNGRSSTSVPKRVSSSRRTRLNPRLQVTVSAPRTRGPLGSKG